MKVGICDENIIIKRHLLETLQTIYSEDRSLVFHTYTPNEIAIDVEDMLFDCEILILNTDYPESGMDGIDLVLKINDAFPNCKIIYVSENENAIKDVYETNHCYYIRYKDIEQMMKPAIQKAIRLVQEDSQHSMLEVICEGHHVFINHEDIIYIEKYGRTINIVTSYREYICYNSLSGIQRNLACNMVRVHGGYVVNLAYVSYLGVEQMEMQNGKVIPIGRTYRKNVRDAYQNYWKK